MTLSGRSRSRGFSLLETLIAFSIMAMVLGALYHSVGNSVRGAAEAERSVSAVLLAQSLLALHPNVPAVGVSGSGVSSDQTYRWRVDSKPFDQDAQPGSPALHEVSVEVSWQDRGRDRSFGLFTVVPERSGP